jgi:hypothetical protein
LTKAISTPHASNTVAGQVLPASDIRRRFAASNAERCSGAKSECLYDLCHCVFFALTFSRQFDTVTPYSLVRLTINASALSTARSGSTYTIPKQGLKEDMGA